MALAVTMPIIAKTRYDGETPFRQADTATILALHFLFSLDQKLVTSKSDFLAHSTSAYYFIFEYLIIERMVPANVLVRMELTT